MKRVVKKRKKKRNKTKRGDFLKQAYLKILNAKCTHFELPPS
jgi:hypothetical protein